MIYEINLTEYAKARVWYDETPPIRRLQGNSIHSKIENTQYKLINNVSKLGVEIYIPVGPMAKYGLIAGVFEPRLIGNCLDIDVLFENGKETWSGSLANMVDDVFIGLDEDYAKEVNKVFLTEAPILGPGLLKIDIACQGEIGSSINFFGEIAAAYAKILMICSKEDNSSRIENELRMCFF